MEEKTVKITDRLISIPPYLSTGWGAVSHVRVSGERLIFAMKDGELVSIPNPSHDLIKLVFENHVRFLDFEAKSLKEKREGNFSFKVFGAAFPEGLMPPPDLMRMGLGSPDLVNMMQHNPDQKNIEDLPWEVVDKISKIIKIVTPSDPEMFPKPEPHCNCPYCQIARCLHEVVKVPIVAPAEEPVSPGELAFSQFYIEPAGDKLYHVIDKLFPAEKFTVFLGEPVGCTCGKAGCEHIIAVLKS